jgi:outer membrane receptor protein involved in Fe transport
MSADQSGSRFAHRSRARGHAIATSPRWWAWVIALLGLLSPHAAFAQLGTGVLIGRIVSAATDQPILDVVVSATSPALQGEQVVITDATGSFRIPNLPPGIYSVRYEVDGYRPYERTGVALESTVTLRLDAAMLPLSLEAREVVVVGAPPTVDVGSTQSGLTITRDFTERLPLAPATGKGGAARSFEQVAEVAPTVRNDAYGASIAGTTSVENQYIIDGLSVGDPGFGFNSTPLSIDFIQETHVVTGGYLPEYGRGGGGVLDVVTKSGSNTLRGSLFMNLTPWQAPERLPPEQDSIRVVGRLKNIWDIGFDLGGPIIRDKLWFYGGLDVSHAAYSLQRDLMGLFTDSDGQYVRDDDGLIVSGRIPGTRTNYDAVQTQLQYLFKLTYAPSGDDRIEVTHRGTPSWGGGGGDYALSFETGGIPADIAGSYEATARVQRAASFDTSLKWTHSALNKRVTFDTMIGWHHERTADLPVDGSEIGSGVGLAGLPRFQYRRTNPEPRSITEFETLPDPSVCEQRVEGGDAICPATGYVVGGPALLSDLHFNRLQVREVATLVARALGQHVAKAGVELELVTYSSIKSYPGDTLFRESVGGTQVDDFRQYGSLTGPDQPYLLPALRYATHSIGVGGFVQDSWAIVDRVTLNLGARYDAQFLYADQGLELSLPNQWSPRIGVIVDPLGGGASKLFANYAVYYQTFPLNIVDRAGSGEPALRSRRSFANCNPSSPDYPESCRDPANLLTLPGKSPADPNQKWAYISVGPAIIDPDIDSQSSSELSLGGQYSPFPNAVFAVTYIRRWMNNVIEDMSRDEGATFFIGNPGRGIASDFPKVERTYDAGIFSVTKTFSDLWLAQASYTLSWLRGNWDGLFRAQTGQLDPGTNSDFDVRAFTINRQGPLSGERRHELKLFLARDVPLGPQHHLELGGSYRARSGAPTNYLAAHAAYGADEVYLLPRGSGLRLPWQHTVDGHVGYTFAATEQRSWAVSVDIFNLLDLRGVTSRGQRYTARPVDPITGAAAQGPFVNGDRRFIDPGRIRPTDGDARPFDETDRSRTFGAPLAYQEPLSIRFGLRSTF